MMRALPGTLDSENQKEQRKVNHMKKLIERCTA
jgi:hypothetical protein